jgi:hypothetical protein
LADFHLWLIIFRADFTRPNIFWDFLVTGVAETNGLLNIMGTNLTSFLIIMTFVDHLKMLFICLQIFKFNLLEILLALFEKVNLIVLSTLKSTFDEKLSFVLEYFAHQLHIFRKNFGQFLNSKAVVAT